MRIMANKFLHICLIIFTSSCSTLFAAEATLSKTAHPFIWWTKADAQAIKAQIDQGGEAAKQLEITKDALLTETPKAKPLWDLFQFMVYGDEAARDRQLAALRNFIGQQPETDVGGTWVVNNASTNDAHMRDEQSMNVLRYDMLYDHLTEAERAGVEDTFRVYIEFQLSGHRPIHPHFGYGRTDTLPNMHWPRAAGTHLMAVALQDEKLIQEVWQGYGGWYWFFDYYLADGFYMEEFAKYYSNIGTMMLICEGLERLGMGDTHGYGYVSKSGATVRDFLFMPVRISYPKTDIPDGRSRIGVVQMGDTPARGHLQGIFSHAFVNGYLRPGVKPPKKFSEQGNNYFTGPRMNGPFAKMMAPLWCEIGHRRYPQAGFDYFLAQMRHRDQDTALPTLLFGLSPIDPNTAQPPTPQSIVSDLRGFAFLKSDETPTYWTSGHPAAALQFGMYYVHYAHDCFSLLGYHAFNRPIYATGWGGNDDHVKNHNIASGGKGYIGGHAWKDTIRGHAGVTVDNLKPRPVDPGYNGCENQRIRSEISDSVKFVTVAAENMYPGVWQERSLFLTKEYMIDFFANHSKQEHRYEWNVNGAGTVITPDWEPTTELNGSMLYRDIGESQPAGYDTKRDANDPIDVRKKTFDTTWSTHIVHDYHGDNVEKSLFGPKWFDRGIGVRLTTAGQAGTIAFAGRPPIGANGPLSDLPQHSEIGGAWLNVRRQAANTNFIVLHQPFEKGEVPTSTLTTLADTKEVIAVAVQGVGGVDKTTFNDRAMLATGRDISTPHTITNGDESFTFHSHLWIRINDGAITIIGHPTALTIPASPETTLTINGTAVQTTFANGSLNWNGPSQFIAPTAKPQPTYDDEIDELIAQLSHTSTSTREHASIKLGRMGAKAAKAIPHIIKGMSMKTTIGNKLAAETLSWMGEPALAALQELLHSDDPYVRAEALYGLQSYQGDVSSVIPDVIVCLKDANRYVRRNALKFIIKMGPAAADAVPAIEALFSDHVNATYAAYALSAIGTSAVPAAKKQLDNPATTTIGLNILAGMGPAAAPLAEQIANLLRGPNTKHALKAVAAIGPAAATQLDHILPLLADQDNAIANEAAAIVQSLASTLEPAAQEKAVSHLIANSTAETKTGERVLRSAVIRALGHFNQAASKSFLIETATQPNIKTDDRRNGLTQLFTEAVRIAGSEPELQEKLKELFSADPKNNQIRHLNTLLAIVPTPAFPLAACKEHFSNLLLSSDPSAVSLGAAALLALDSNNESAASALSQSLTYSNRAKRRQQNDTRDHAWKLLQLANRHTWTPDWPVYLEHQDSDIRSRALQALVAFPEALERHKATVSQLLDHPHPQVALAAAATLITGQSSHASAALTVYVSSAKKLSWNDRAKAVGHMSKLGTHLQPAIIEALIEFSRDEDFFVRKAAEGAIYELTH